MGYFLNKYKLKDTNNSPLYNKTRQIGEYIYSVGSINILLPTEQYKTIGVITQFDLYGNIIWMKCYNPANGGFIIYDVIDCNGNIIVSGNSSTYNVLIQLSPKGNIIWKKSYSISQIGHANSNLLEIDTNTYISVGYSGFFTFDKNGSFLQGNTLSYWGNVSTTTNAIIKDSLIIISRSFNNSSTGKKVSLINILDLTLNTNRQLMLFPEGNDDIFTSTKFINFKDSLICFLNYKENCHSFLLNPYDTPAILSTTLLSTTIRSCFNNENNIFLNDSHSSVFKFDDKFNQLWGKFISHNVEQIYPDSILCSSQSGNLGRLNLNFDSCKTINNSNQISKLDSFIEISTETFPIPDKACNIIDPDISITELEVTQEEVCTFTDFQITLTYSTLTSQEFIKDHTLAKKSIGTLTLKNTGTQEAKIPAGTKIIPDINGLQFTTEQTIIIPAGSFMDVSVLVNGTPESTGVFNELIQINSVENPNQFKIEFNIKAQNCDFYVKKYSNKTLGSTEILKMKELSSGFYSVGTTYNRTLSRSTPYFLKLGDDGSILSEKSYDFENSTQGGSMGDIIQFSDIYELNDKKILLLASDKNNAWLLKTDQNGTIIWKKKFHDVNDVAYSNSLYTNYFLLQFSDDRYVLAAEEMHSNSSVFKIEYKFISINGNTGEIINSKKYNQPGNTLLFIRNIKSDGKNIYLTGRYQNKAFIFSLDSALNITDSFSLNSDNPDTQFMYGWELSNINQNQLSLLGWHSSKTGNDHFVSKIDLSTRKILKSKLFKNEFKQTSQKIYQDSRNIYFSQWDNLYKLSSDLDFIWGKSMNDYPEVMQMYSDKIYSYDHYTQKYPGANFFIAKTNKEYDSCITVPLENLISEELNLSLSPFILALEDHQPTIYSDPVNCETFSITETLVEDICPCEEKPETPKPNAERKTLFHQVEWLSENDHEYNIHIPGIDAVQEDGKSTITGLTQYIQPIWRPDTLYRVKYKLKDKVRYNGKTYDNIKNTFTAVYGFKTAGPLGHFHLDPDSSYGADILIQQPDGTSLKESEKYPEKYPHTSLKQYIDYNRSYPNADGNIINAKPLFYDDETTEIRLHFTKNYIEQMFSGWKKYKGLPALNGIFKIIIKDPAEDINIINPPRLDVDTEYQDIPQTEENWIEETDPRIPFEIQQWLNLAQANQCNLELGDLIQPPKNKVQVVKPRYLQPQKLYTAQVLNYYWGDLSQNPENMSREKLEELKEKYAKEVHKFVFQTSRYKDFIDQISSCILKDPEGNTRLAEFTLEKEISQEQINAIQEEALNYFSTSPITNPLSQSLESRYTQAFDRILEGILKLSPEDTAISTEFNKIINTHTGKIAALWIRNPEPFNHPKIPIQEIQNTIRIVDENGKTDTSYQTVFSKDYSQVLIVNTTQGWNKVNIQFEYKQWKGTEYQTVNYQHTFPAPASSLINNIIIK